MQAPKLVTPPSGAVVTLEEVKEHCRIYYDDDDTYLQTLIDVATAHCDGWRGITGRCLLTQTWQTQHWDWPICSRPQYRDYYLSPFPDIQSVTVVYDTDDGEETLPDDKVVVFSDRIRFRLSLPSLISGATTYPIRVNWTCGYDGDVPHQIKLSIKMFVAHWYENREAVTTAQNIETLPMGPRELLKHFRAFT